MRETSHPSRDVKARDVKARDVKARDVKARDVKASLETLLRGEPDLSFRQRVPLVLEFLDPQPADRILDCGCGMGFTLRVMSERYTCSLIGLDRTSQAITYGRQALRSTRVRLVRGDALRLPFPDHAFDKVLMTEVLEHLPDDVCALREIRRVLRPGGICAVSVPNHNYPFLWDPLNKTLEIGFGYHVPSHIWWLAGIWADHQRLYTPQTITHALQLAGFVVTEVRPITHYCLPFHHFLVYGLGKNLLQSGLLPRSVAKVVDRFQYRADPQPPALPLKLVLRLLDWMDKRNRPLTDPSLSYVDIAVRAEKPRTTPAHAPAAGARG
jgi:ubiquinone/menaquinone biosynthesis C-methylase UbiE